MQTHSFSVEAAIRYGLTEAIMLQLLSSWLDERSQDEDYFCWEGRPWLKLTMRQFQSELPYLSPFKLQTSLELLQSCKLIDIYDEKMENSLRRRKLMSYSLTERGYAITHKEDL